MEEDNWEGNDEELEEFWEDDDSTQDLLPKDEELEQLYKSSQAENKHSSSLLDECLKNQPEDVKRDVRKIVEISGIDSDDPFFLILLCCRINQVLLQLAPKQLSNTFDNGGRMLIELFDKHSTKLIEAQKKYLQDSKKDILAISTAQLNREIAKILGKNNIETKGGMSPRVKGVIATSVATSIALIVGGFAGWSMKNSATAQNSTYSLTAEEKVSLDWVQSEEGRLAKKIIDWNEDLVGQQCQKSAKDLGITYRIGSAEAVSGFCVVFTEPPEKRKYVEK